MLGVVRKISPPPPFLPMVGKAASPLEGEAEEEKDFEVPTCRSFAAASSPLKGGGKSGELFVYFPLERKLHNSFLPFLKGERKRLFP